MAVFSTESFEADFYNVKDEWEFLRAQKGGDVCKHCLMVVYWIMKDNDFAKLSTENKNILLWAGLFHDIKKRGTQLISDGKDPLHPFRSATTFLSIANRLKLCVVNDTNTTDFKKGL